MPEKRRVSPFAWPLIVLITVYRYTLSPLLHMIAPGAGCRYHPTCSVYALEAFRRFGAVRGSWLAFRRLTDCHPWGGSGNDVVPTEWPGWWFSRRSLSSPPKSRVTDARSSLPRSI